MFSLYLPVFSEASVSGLFHEIGLVCWFNAFVQWVISVDARGGLAAK